VGLTSAKCVSKIRDFSSLEKSELYKSIVISGVALFLPFLCIAACRFRPAGHTQEVGPPLPVPDEEPRRFPSRPTQSQIV